MSKGPPFLTYASAEFHSQLTVESNHSRSLGKYPGRLGKKAVPWKQGRHCRLPARKRISFGRGYTGEVLLTVGAGASPFVEGALGAFENLRDRDLLMVDIVKRVI